MAAVAPRRAYRPSSSRFWPRSSPQVGGVGQGRIVRLHLAGRLVLAQPLECSLPYIPTLGKACEFNLGDELRLQPMHVAGLARRILATERALVRGRGLQRGHDALDLVLPEAGA